MDKKRLFSFGASLALLFFIFGALFVYAQTANEIFTISQGVYPTGATYTLAKDASSQYYVKNGFGVVLDTDSNASALMADILSAQSGDNGISVYLIGYPDILEISFDYVYNCSTFYGVGTVEITTSNNGVTMFVLREHSEIYHVFIKHESANPVQYVSWTPSLAFYNQWTDFPSNGGIPTGTPGMIWDGFITTESVGYINVPSFWTAGTTYQMRMGTAGKPYFESVATGKKVMNYGIATIADATTSVVIEHQLETTPYIVVLGATEVACGLVWWGEQNTTHFTVHSQWQPNATEWYISWLGFSGTS